MFAGTVSSGAVRSRETDSVLAHSDAITLRGKFLALIFVRMLCGLYCSDMTIPASNYIYKYVASNLQVIAARPLVHSAGPCCAFHRGIGGLLFAAYQHT